MKPTKKASAQTEEFVLRLDELDPVEHHWVDRGLVMSCEGAGHPFHQVYKVVPSGRSTSDGSQTPVSDH